MRDLVEAQGSPSSGAEARLHTSVGLQTATTGADGLVQFDRSTGWRR